MSRNASAPGTKSVHGTDPQFLIEKIIRDRIYDSLYWKEECYDLDVQLLLDKAVRLSHVGSTFGGNQKPTSFLCLLLKLLQLQPEKDIVYALIEDDAFKYLRVLAAFYLRMVGRPKEIYEHLEPLLADYRKIRVKGINTDYSILCVDQIVESLLTEDRLFNIVLPRLLKRKLVETTEDLKPRIHLLSEELEEFPLLPEELKTVSNLSEKIT